LCLAGGRGLLRASMPSAPAGPCCARSNRLSCRFVEPVALILSSKSNKKKEPARDSFFVWLGDVDYSGHPCPSPCGPCCARSIQLSCWIVEPVALILSPKSNTKKSPRGAPFCIGWGTWIRTTVGGVRVRKILILHNYL